MTKQEFCTRFGITEKQFTGEEKHVGSLDLSSLTSIPEGFNPTVGGYLDLSSLTSIPEGFNPTVGGYLDLSSLTSIPEGFNPAVGGDLYLSSLTSIPEGFNPTVGGDLYLRSLTSIPEGFNPTVGGDLDLRSLTSIPEGFNPTVGGSLYLSSLTSIPEGFNPTVGGYLYWKNNQKHIGATVPIIVIPVIELTWQNGRFIKVDGIFCEVANPERKSKILNGVEITRVKKLNQNKEFFIAKKDGLTAHGETIEKSIEDLGFKIASAKIKSEKINEDTEFTVMLYRMLTGACDFGCRDFMDKNGIPYKIEEDKTVEINPIKAKDLLIILEKSRPYGFEKFKSLLNF